MARAMPVFERFYTEVNGRHTTMYPGVREGLEQMRAAGFRLACVTNKAGAFTLAAARAHRSGDFFRADGVRRFPGTQKAGSDAVAARL